MLPELNQAVKNLNGQFHLLAKLRFIWKLKVQKVKKMFGVVFGVIPEFQGKGVESAIVTFFADGAHAEGENYRYKDFEMNWIGDFNPKMMRVAEDVGGKIYKTHITFRKLFDENKPFERMKSID